MGPENRIIASSGRNPISSSHKKKVTTLRQALEGAFSEDELSRLKTAFDVVGDIAIIEIDDEFLDRKQMIGEALLCLHKNIKVVCMKTGIHDGEFRIQPYEVVAGESRKETVHKENGCRIKLDIEKTYFSARLSTERKIVAEKVRKGEKVLVMFSGVAPYPVVIARNAEPEIVYGVEKNPDAHEYALENVRLNKIRNAKVICGDAREEVPKIGMKFDRILMPLPKNAQDFLDVALDASHDGTIIHFYDFLHEDEFAKAQEKIRKACSEAKKTFKLLEVRKVGQQSPHVYRICVDFEVGK